MPANPIPPHRDPDVLLGLLRRMAGGTLFPVYGGIRECPFCHQGAERFWDIPHPPNCVYRQVQELLKAAGE